MSDLSAYSGLLLTGALAFTMIGIGMGVMFMIVHKDTTLALTRKKHKEEMDVIYEEVKRLRAQNAMLIGKE